MTASHCDTAAGVQPGAGDHDHEGGTAGSGGRDTRGGIIPEGTSEIQTLIIGRELLGLSAFGTRDA